MSDAQTPPPGDAGEGGDPAGRDRFPPSGALERTVLSWRRTGLSLIAAGIAIARGIPLVHGVPGRPGVGFVVLGLGAALVAMSSRAAARRRAASATPTAAQLAELAPLALGTAVVAVAAFVVVALR